MEIIGLGDRYNYRFFNIIFQSLFVYAGIRTFAKSNAEDFNFLSGTITGLQVTLVGVIPFALFHLFRLAFNPELVSFLQLSIPVVGPYITPLTAGLLLMAEGVAAGLVIAYISMRIVDDQYISAKKPYAQIDRASTSIRSTQS